MISQSVYFLVNYLLLQITEFQAALFGQVCNAYTELNDPAVQRARFEQQAKDKVGFILLMQKPFKAKDNVGFFLLMMQQVEVKVGFVLLMF